MNGSRNKTKILLSSNFDLAGLEFPRVIRLLMLNRLIPLGNLAGSGGLRCLLILAVLHSFGGLLFRGMIRYEQQIHSFYMVLKRIKK